MRIYNISILITLALAAVQPELSIPDLVYRVYPHQDDHIQMMMEVDEVAEIEINTDFFADGTYWALENHEDHEWYDVRRLKDATVHGYGFNSQGELVNLDSIPIITR